MKTQTRSPARWAAALIATLASVAFAAPASAAPPDTADAVEVFAGDVFEIVGSTLRNPTEATDPSARLFSNSGGASPRTDVRLTFTGLVPNGVYSVFWGTLQPDSENPLCPGVERTLALPSVDPGQAPDSSSFVAGPDGTASFRGRLSGSLLDSAAQVFFSLVYHFNGTTYGPLPNAGEFLTQGENCRSSFGEDAMRQLLILQKW